MKPEEFDREVADATAALTLPMIENIAENKMPECFNTSRALLVALSRMLMVALVQNEEMAIKLQQDQPKKIIVTH